MATYYETYPTLWAASGGNLTGILNKFPFLCKLDTMALAIGESGLLGDARRNTNGYDKWEAAEKMAEWLDTFLDYSTGKIPKALELSTNLGYKMNQKEFWQAASAGFHTVLEDPGYGAVSATISDMGRFGHYSTNQIASASNTPAPTGGYHSDPQKASIQGILSTSSSIDYVDTGLTSGFQPNIDTAHTGITSDDIVGISYQLYGLKGRDRANNEMDLDTWHFPIGIPGPSHIYAGRKTDWLSSNDVVSKYSVTQGEIDAQKASGGYEGSPVLSQYYGGYIAPWVHFDKDAGFTNKQTSMLGSVDDVEPAWKFVLMPYIWPGTYTYPVWERTRNTYVAFDIFSMESREGDYIPATATLNGIWDGSNFVSGTDVDIDPTTGDWWEPANSGATNPGRLVFYLNTFTGGIETKARTTNDFEFYGIPYYDVKVQYTDGGTQYIRNFSIPFHYLTTWDLVGTWDGSGYRGVTAGVSLANTQGNGGETAGVTGNATADYVDAFGTTQTSTAYVTCWALISASVLESGSGYALSQDPLEVIFDYPAGRYYQNPLGGKASTTSSNNNPYVSPNGNKNVDSQALAEATLGRLDRPVDTIFYGNYDMTTPNSVEYNDTPGFFGTDHYYEKEKFAIDYTLSGTKITGFDYTSQTYTETVGADAAPGLEYGNRAYHPDKNPHGDDTSYVSNTWGSGEDSEIWYTKNKASFNVLIADGKVTGFTPRYRDDGNGTAVRGGWGYSTGQDYTPLTFVRDPSVNLPAGYIPPSVYIRVTSDIPADNGYGLKAYMGSLSDPNIEFYPGKNVPDGAFLYAVAYGSGSKASIIEPDENYDTTAYYQRQWHPNIDPSSVRVQIERPVLTSQTRSLKTINVGTGAHRYTFELEYPPMDKDDAEQILALFDRYKGPMEEISLWIPRTGISHLGDWRYYTAPWVSERPEIISNGYIGDDRITVSGFSENQSTKIPKGTHFTIQGQKKVYKVVDSANADQYGRMEILIEPPLVTGVSGQYLDTDRGFKDGADYFQIRAYIMDDTVDYRIGADGLYRLSPIKFRESL